MRQSLSARMADVAQANRKQLTESVFYARHHTTLWRAAAVIISHHPDMARYIFLYLSLNASPYSDPDTMERLSEKWNHAAALCGRASGVFDDAGEKCNGSRPILALTEQEESG